VRTSGWQLLAGVGAGALAACFDPTIRPGSPCESSATCPSGQQCDPSSLTCELAAADAADADGSDVPTSGACWPSWYDGTIRFTVTAIAELANSAAQEHPSLSEDDLTLYFDRTVPGRARDFYVSTRAAVGSPWGTPVELAELDSTLDEERVTVGESGTYAVFASTRGGGAAELWSATRPTATGAFSTPGQTDVAADNVASEEFDPQLSRDGLRLYHSPVSGSGTQTIALASRTSTAMPFGAPVALPELSIAGVVGDPTLSPDELLIVFAANMGLARYMYYAIRPNSSASFGTPVEVPDVSSGAYDGNGTLSSTGCELIFMSTRSGTKALYVANAQ